MKKNYLFFLTLFILSSITLAQSYQPINSGRTALFANDAENVQAIRIDSVKFENNDSILYPFTNIRLVDELNQCFSPYAPSWIGKHVIVKPDGTNLFFNKLNDTIRIQTQSSLGESWLAYDNQNSLKIMASISAHDTMSFLGQIDSVKTIAFQAYDNNMQPVSNDINSKSISTSKQFGFVETLPFYLFPDMEEVYPNEQFESLSIVGLSNPEIGMQNLTWFAAHDFQVGDIIHTEYHYYDFELNEVQYTALKYLERLSYADSLVYRAEREKLYIQNSPNYSISNLFDTITIKITKNMDFDFLPLEPINDNGAATRYFSSIDNNRMRKSSIWSDVILEEPNAPCDWVLAGVVGQCIFSKNLFIEGLGGPYNDCEPFTGMTYSTNELVYYLKGDEDWGTEIDFSVGIESVKEKNQFSLSPNPANGSFTINGSYLIGKNIQILNLQGQEVKR